MAPIAEIEHRWVETGRPIALLVLLEYEYPMVLDKIKGTSISAQDLSKMVAYSLDFDSRHWAEKAVTWIEAGFPIDKEMCGKLMEISASKRDSQSLRHRSLKQAKRWLRKVDT
jgi:hypothetical protein